MSLSRPLPFPALDACPPVAELPPEVASTLLAEGIAVSQVDADRLGQFVQLVLAGNALTNLTALRTPQAVWEGLILDSLRLVPLLGHLAPASQIVDVGCGAGFPGLPLALLFPQLEFTLVDATAKKVAFVEHARHQLKLPNVTPICGRAEQLTAASDDPKRRGLLRERFDLVTARAVAPLPLLLELCVPFAKAPQSGNPGGRLLLVKGEQAERELDEATRAIQLLAVAHLETRTTPSSRLLSFQKLRPTDARFPRPNGAPKRNPL